MYVPLNISNTGRSSSFLEFFTYIKIEKCYSYSVLEYMYSKLRLNIDSCSAIKNSMYQ